MAKPELGTKRVCPVTGRKFYDLNKDPVISPYTGEIVPITPLAVRGRPATAGAGTKVGAGDDELVDNENAEFVSLEDADAEAQGKSKHSADIPDTGDDIEVDDDDSGDDADVFIEDEEESDDDVADIIGDGIDKEEES